MEYFKNLKELLINFQICGETDVFGASWSPTFWNRESCQRKNTKNAQSIKKHIGKKMKLHYWKILIYFHAKYISVKELKCFVNFPIKSVRCLWGFITSYDCTSQNESNMKLKCYHFSISWTMFHWTLSSEWYTEESCKTCSLSWLIKRNVTV